MAPPKPKYRLRSVLLIIGYILLCVGGGFFVYLILLGNRSSTESGFGFGRFVVWAIGLTIVGIGFIGLLLIYKLLDYSDMKRSRRTFSSLEYDGDLRCPKCNFLVTAEDAKGYRNICPDCKTDWRIYPLKKDTETN